MLFAKPPVEGRAKTRLAPLVGPSGAADLARHFLKDSWSALQGIEGVQPMISTHGAEPAAFDLEPVPKLFEQGEGDLGARIERTMQYALGQGDRAFAIGADAPDLGRARFEDARRALDGADAVMIPATDGGFVLLGLRACPPGLLDGVPWSDAKTATETLARLRHHGMTVRVLEPWHDVDEPHELRALADRLARVPGAAPHTAAHLKDHPLPPTISVVVPVLDEAVRIEGCLQRLCAAQAIDEVIVVDGGSCDGTVELARTHPVTLIEAPVGRGRQMNAGAEASSGEILWFVHADVALPAGAAGAVRSTLEDPHTVAGAFVTWTVHEGAPAHWSLLLHAADIRSRVTRRPYGDQALFVRRDCFEAAGRFPDIPIMEDVALANALARQGHIARVHERVLVSGRRFVHRPLRTMLAWNTLPMLYRAGVSPDLLASLYGSVR